MQRKPSREASLRCGQVKESSATTTYVGKHNNTASKVNNNDNPILKLQRKERG
eukprot:m.56046 g.56046  ORF g.56046 m.56046 type:complete len:53 (+) comp18701_c0_seq1:866-1024(+)